MVRAQLLLSLPGTLLSSVLQHPIVQFPVAYAVQLRLNAENPTDAFRPSTGTICASQLSWPGGRGVRVDTWLTSARVFFEEPVWNIGSDFDSLSAKIIVRGRTFEEATQRAKRALRETRTQSDIKTNLDVLAGVVGHKDWVERTIDTLWLERSIQDVLQVGRTVLQQRSFASQTSQNLGSSSGAGSHFRITRDSIAAIWNKFPARVNRPHVQRPVLSKTHSNDSIYRAQCFPPSSIWDLANIAIFITPTIFSYSIVVFSIVIVRVCRS